MLFLVILVLLGMLALGAVALYYIALFGVCVGVLVLVACAVGIASLTGGEPQSILWFVLVPALIGVMYWVSYLDKCEREREEAERKVKIEAELLRQRQLQKQAGPVKRWMKQLFN